MPTHLPAPTILIAEDDPNDLVLLQMSLAAAGATHPTKIFGNGAEVIQFLRDHCVTAERADAIGPRLLFLDLHLPQIDGCGVIAWIRRQKVLTELRIVVVSGSSDSLDVKRAEALGASRILTKPPAVDALRAELAQLANFAPLQPPPGPSGFSRGGDATE